MGFFALVWRILEGVRKVLHLILLLVIFGFILAALHTSIPTVPRSAALVIAPEGELVEQLASDPLRRAFGQASGGPAPETLLKDVIDAIGAGEERLAHQADRRCELGNLSHLGTVETAGDRRRPARVSRRRQARGGGGRFPRSDAVLPRRAGRRGVPRSARPGLRRRLQLLPHVLARTPSTSSAST